MTRRITLPFGEELIESSVLLDPIRILTERTTQGARNQNFQPCAASKHRNTKRY